MSSGIFLGIVFILKYRESISSSFFLYRVCITLLGLKGNKLVFLKADLIVLGLKVCMQIRLSAVRNLVCIN